MAADKFNCPKCHHITTVANVVSGREVTRYRHCRICNVNFTTIEKIKDTPKIRQWVGEVLASKLWPKPGFKYRTIAQQKRVTKTDT